jgi:hypothetical protein
VTLQGTLLNHTVTVAAVAAHISNYQQVLADNGPIPFILGESNSLYGEGLAGLSNTFGAAIWGVDFYLYAASQGIQRVHFHQGTDFRVSVTPGRYFCLCCELTRVTLVRRVAARRHQQDLDGHQGPLLR